MELLIMVDALKRSSAGRINLVMPYFGYARQARGVWLLVAHAPVVEDDGRPVG